MPAIAVQHILHSVFCILYSAFYIQAQTSTASPYSRYGLGDLNTYSFSNAQGMGGIGAGLQNDSLAPFNINIYNPASYSSLKLSTFEVGATGNKLDVQSATSSYSSGSASLGYVAMGIPVKRWWGLAFGLTPFSNVGMILLTHGRWTA